VAEEPAVTASRLAWGLFAVWALLVATAFVLGVGHVDEGGFAPALVLFAGVGALVSSRQPGNRLGWVLLAAAIALAITDVLASYTATASDPAPVVLWLDDWFSNVWIALAGVWIPLLFPDGRLLSGRWGVVAWAGTAAFVLMTAGNALGAGALDTAGPIDPENPYALPGAAGNALATAARVGDTLAIFAALGAAAGLIVRLRRSRGVERQQLKWFAYVGALMLFALFISALSLLDPERLGDTVGTIGWMSFFGLFVFGLPLAIGAAILRHRLYDIDVVINRTLVYGALTATLAAAYLSLALLLGLTVGRSDFTIAISTLAVAALFGPARARIQATVDRRFYRRRYDAEQTLAAFSGRLRDELDLDALRGEIAAVVGETVQPAHVSVWLREGR
jgi:hypothetical protein